MIYYLTLSSEKLLKIAGTLNRKTRKTNDPLLGARVKVVPRTENDEWASELGAESNTYLMIYNPSETTDGAYEVMVGNPE